jgi:ABC-type branched-subunit amino acid transport system substrate-binding protein
MRRWRSTAERTGGSAAGLALLGWLAAVGALGCGDTAPGPTIPIGLMLSYSGQLAANSINSERAFRMAIESVNAAGGIEGRQLRVMARDTRSDPLKVSLPARELLDAGVAVFVGPDTNELLNQLRAVLSDRVVVLPSFATASIDFKPDSWFVMGASPARMACELVAQLRAHDRRNPLVIVNARGYNSQLGYELSVRHGMPKFVLPTEEASTTSTARPIAAVDADAYVLAALPTSASPLIEALAAIGELEEPERWYLSPTLHTPAFLDSIPRGALPGAQGVSSGTAAGAADFRSRFYARWQDAPLDDAYPFYDSAALISLALQRAVARGGTISQAGTDLAPHLRAVSSGGGVAVRWDELDQGLALLREGQEVSYAGLSGSTAFDALGQIATAATNWWTIDERGFADIPKQSECR